MFRRFTLVLAVCLGALSSAAAADLASLDDAQASLSWRLSFGGAARGLHAGYALTLGYRAAPDAPAAHFLELDVSDAAASANLAGFPLLARSHRANQSEDAPLGEPASRPWFARQWVLWTAAGLGVTAAALADMNESFGGSEGDDGDGSATPNCEESGGCGVACTNGDCVVPCATFPDCVTLLPQDLAAYVESVGDYRAESDAGTGGMGDLISP